MSSEGSVDEEEERVSLLTRAIEAELEQMRASYGADDPIAQEVVRLYEKKLREKLRLDAAAVNALAPTPPGSDDEASGGVVADSRSPSNARERRQKAFTDLAAGGHRRHDSAPSALPRAVSPPPIRRVPSRQELLDEANAKADALEAIAAGTLLPRGGIASYQASVLVGGGAWQPPMMSFPFEVDDTRFCCGWRCCCEVYTWRSRLNFLLLLMIEIASEASRGLTLPTMYLYVRELGGDLGTLASLVSTFSLGRMIASPLFGAMAEKHTYALGFVMSISISIAGNILWCACSNHELPAAQRFAILFLSRFITGFGAGNRSICRAFTVKMVHHSDRLVYITLLEIAVYVGYAVTPGVAGLLPPDKGHKTELLYGFFPNTVHIWPGVILATFNLVVLIFMILCFREDVAPIQYSPTARKAHKKAVKKAVKQVIKARIASATASRGASPVEGDAAVAHGLSAAGGGAPAIFAALDDEAYFADGAVVRPEALRAGGSAAKGERSALLRPSSSPASKKKKSKAKSKSKAAKPSEHAGCCTIARGQCYVWCCCSCLDAQGGGGKGTHLRFVQILGIALLVFIDYISKGTQAVYESIATSLFIRDYDDEGVLDAKGVMHYPRHLHSTVQEYELDETQNSIDVEAHLNSPVYIVASRFYLYLGLAGES